MKQCGFTKQKWATTWQNQQSHCVPSDNSDQPGHLPSLISLCCPHEERGVRVAERLALRSSDHGVAGSNPAGGEILPEPKRRFIAQSLSCSPFHRLEMTEILLKGLKTLTHPSIRMKKAWVLSYPLSASEDSDQTGRMPRLIWVFAGHTLILLVLSFHDSWYV